MSSPISLTIQMNLPCDENWNSMDLTDQGRFCNKCLKPVIDFTGLTDQQILQYFLKHPFPVCGRLLSDQKDRQFGAPAPKINRNLSPVAASLLTLAAFTTEAEAAPPARQPVNMQQAQMPDNKQVLSILTDSVIISGTVKDGHGAPIENAEIIFEQTKLFSDKNGNFRFTRPAEFNKQAVIQFSYGKLVKEVRSYHPAMGSTSFDVILHEPSYLLPSYTMGIARPAFHLPSPFSTLTFQSTNKLDAKTKAFLSDLATFLKDNPDQRFSIRPYYRSSKQNAIKLSNLIKNFLTDTEGINMERIKIAAPQLRKKNSSEVVIEFTQNEEYD